MGEKKNCYTKIIVKSELNCYRFSKSMDKDEREKNRALLVLILGKKLLHPNVGPLLLTYM